MQEGTEAMTCTSVPFAVILEKEVTDGGFPFDLSFIERVNQMFGEDRFSTSRICCDPKPVCLSVIEPALILWVIQEPFASS